MARKEFHLESGLCNIVTSLSIRWILAGRLQSVMMHCYVNDDGLCIASVMLFSITFIKVTSTGFEYIN
jgi:hypothetical protein